MPIKSKDGKSEIIATCEYCTKDYIEKLIDGEIIIIGRMNWSVEKSDLSKTCELELGDPPHLCGNITYFTIERGFPIQD